MDLLNLLKENNSLCTGCGACYNICPKNAVMMAEDNQGFLYPQINKELCIDCKKCALICPKLHWYKGNAEAPECYAARARDDVRSVSSSGGMFTLLAQYVLEHGGIVCGAKMEKDYGVHHICIDNINELDGLRRSKYVQSNTEFVYREILKELQQNKNRMVLFSGTPCQCAAARNYFGGYENVFIVDVLCHGVPSEKMWKDYLSENFDLEKIDRVEFRSKLNGWRADQLRVFYKNGTSSPVPWAESAYEEGFQKNISLRDGCENCEFSALQRQGDLTVGDFWRIENYDPSLNDHKGTSLVLVNNKKGWFILNAVKPHLLDIVSAPVTCSANRLNKVFKAHPNKRRFKTLYPAVHNFTVSVMQCRHNLYDIGLVSYYTVSNYGGELTQYALYSALTDMGYSVLMIGHPLDSPAKAALTPVLFDKNPYPSYALSKFYPNTSAMKFLNLQCKTFITGSDQMFNNNGYKWFNKFMVQNFVTDNHPKIAYAASWGHDHIWGSEYDRAEESYFIKKFDYFSVREKTAVKLADEKFGVKAVWVLDPVFLCQIKNYKEMAERPSQKLPKGGYLFSYILDTDEQKEKAAKNYAHGKNLRICVIFDAQKKNKKIETKLNDDVITNAKIEDFLALIYNSDFVITDSFHGVCFCIIFHKQFMAFVNEHRGASRFKSLLELLNLENRMCYTAEELEEKINILPPVDYKKVDEILQSEKMRSINWLKSAIEKSKDIFKPLSEFDILDNRLDELSEKMRNSGENQTEELKKLVLTLANKDKIMRKYYRYKLLSKILRGKKGEHYIKKAQIYHEKVRRIRELQKNC